jgi:hypothetical protein
MKITQIPAVKTLVKHFEKQGLVKYANEDKTYLSLKVEGLSLVAPYISFNTTDNLTMLISIDIRVNSDIKLSISNYSVNMIALSDSENEKIANMIINQFEKLVVIRELFEKTTEKTF